MDFKSKVTPLIEPNGNYIFTDPILNFHQTYIKFMPCLLVLWCHANFIFQSMVDYFAILLQGQSVCSRFIIVFILHSYSRQTFLMLPNSRIFDGYSMNIRWIRPGRWIQTKELILRRTKNIKISLNLSIMLKKTNKDSQY